MFAPKWGACCFDLIRCWFWARGSRFCVSVIVQDFNDKQLFRKSRTKIRAPFTIHLLSFIKWQHSAHAPCQSIKENLNVQCPLCWIHFILWQVPSFWGAVGETLGLEASRRGKRLCTLLFGVLSFGGMTAGLGWQSTSLKPPPGFSKS